MPRPKNNNLLQYFAFNNNNRIICNNGNCHGKELNDHSANLERHLRARHKDEYVNYIKNRGHDNTAFEKKEKKHTSVGKRKRTSLKSEDNPLELTSSMIKNENSNGLSSTPAPATRATTTTLDSEHIQQEQQQQFEAHALEVDKLSSSSSHAVPISSLFNSYVDQSAAASTDSYRLLEHSIRQADEEQETSTLDFFKSLMPDYKRLTKSKQRKLKEFFIKKLNEMLDEAEQEQSR